MAAYAALVSVMHIIDNLQLHPRPPISLHKNQVYLLTQKISSLQEFLEGYNPNLGYSEKADPLEIRIADAAYAAEDVIESHIVDRITNDGGKMSSDDGLYEALEKVIEEMALIEKEAMEIKETVGVVEHQLRIKSTPSDSMRPSSIPQKSSMVGADDVKLQMMDKLTADRRDLQIISVVGMSGTGKTTLAINIYRDLLILERFYICAWTTISQEYSIREILVEVLKQLNVEDSKDSSEGVLGEKLYKHLFGRKYLIIMDDMWSIDAWDGVKRFLPDNKNGSRIVITTRLSNLTSKLPNSSSLEMKLLDETATWDLLSKIVFGEKGCPLELVEIGKQIGQNCKGLPLSIVVVGGFLAKSEQTREFWKYIEANLNAIVNLEDDKRCLKIVYMSYKQLPIYLKPCFLYMGIYPEDKVIRISWLIQLWVAEGFLKPVSGKSLEEIAEEYLEDLIGRNLLLIHELDSTGNIKYCKIHDLLRDLCRREAEKERFYTPTPQGIVNGQRRIVISSTASKNEAINTLSSMSLARSLMWDLDDRVQPLLKLLRILDSCTFQENMDQLVNSRFLAISAPSLGCVFPSSIWLFWNLQTLIVRNLRKTDVWNVPLVREFTAPTDIWYMPHIRHVRFRQLLLSDPPNGQDDIVLGNLQTLETIMNFRCSEQVVKRIPNIKKLKIFYDERLYDDKYSLSNLGCLGKLEFLTCTFARGINPYTPDSVERLINFPHSLKKLALHIHKSKCWQGILDKIGALPLLEKLKLEGGSFEEGQWETSEGQFRSLKFLAIRYCEGLQVWTTESSHFPCLEHLILYRMEELKEIPLDFAEISALRVIDMILCSDSAAVSAKRILEEQEELYGEAILRVQVKLLWKNEALESSASPNFRVTCMKFFT